MHTNKRNGIAGNCCCLLPVVILVLIIIAAVIGGALMWEGGTRNLLRWEPRYHNSGAYRDGYEAGSALGAAYATRPGPQPTEADVETVGEREADRLHVTRDRRQWMDGFRRGFARGFENSRRQASSSAWLMPGAGRLAA